jgi:hypothetical protein
MKAGNKIWFLVFILAVMAKCTKTNIMKRVVLYKFRSLSGADI